MVLKSSEGGGREQVPAPFQESDIEPLQRPVNKGASGKNKLFGQINEGTPNDSF